MINYYIVHLKQGNSQLTATEKISALREICNKEEISVNCASKPHQLWDVFTKKSDSVHALMKNLQ